MPAWLAIALFAGGLWAIARLPRLMFRRSLRKQALLRSQIGERPPQARRLTDAEIARKLASIELSRRQYYATLPEDDPRRGRPMNGNAD